MQTLRPRAGSEAAHVTRPVFGAHMPKDCDHHTRSLGIFQKSRLNTDVKSSKTFMNHYGAEEREAAIRGLTVPSTG